MKIFFNNYIVRFGDNLTYGSMDDGLIGRFYLRFRRKGESEFNGFLI